MVSNIWAHRGSSHTYIENTLAAFQQAVTDQADGVELDVQRTKDGELVVVHDENLKRLTGKDVFIWDLTLDEIQNLILTVKSVAVEETDAFHRGIPTLSAVLNLLKDTSLIINIELKNSINLYPNLELEIYDLVNSKGMQEDVIYSSFNHASMRDMANIAGSQYVAILSSDIQHDPITYTKNVGASIYHPMINSMQVPGLVSDFHAHDMTVNVWTVDDEAMVYLALLQEADALITNEPAKIREFVNKFEADGGKEAIELLQSLGLMKGA